MEIPRSFRMLLKHSCITEQITNATNTTLLNGHISSSSPPYQSVNETKILSSNPNLNGHQELTPRTFVIRNKSTVSGHVNRLGYRVTFDGDISTISCKELVKPPPGTPEEKFQLMDNDHHHVYAAYYDDRDNTVTVRIIPIVPHYV